MAVTDGQSPAQMLARKLSLLLDVAAALDRAPTFTEIQDALEQWGVRLSRARWGYMIAGTGTVVRDRALLAALSRFFGVDEEFLCSDTAELPPAVAAQLDLVRALRAARVKHFAMRTLGDVSPRTLQAITAFLDEEIHANTRETAANTREVDANAREIDGEAGGDAHRR